MQEPGRLRLVQAQGRAALQRRDRHDLRRQLHRRPDPGPQGPAHRSPWSAASSTASASSSRPSPTPTSSGCSSSATASSAASAWAWSTSCRSPCCRSGSPTSRASSPASRWRASGSARSSRRPLGAAADRQHPRHPDQGLPARSGIGYLVAILARRLVLPEPAAGLPRRAGAMAAPHGPPARKPAAPPRRAATSPRTRPCTRAQWYLLTAHPHPQRHRGHLAHRGGGRQRDRRRRLLHAGGGQPRRHPRPLQRRRTHPVGLAVRQDRQDAGLHGHPRHPGRLPASSSRTLANAGAVRGARRARLHLLRRRLRHHAVDGRASSSGSPTPAPSTA